MINIRKNRKERKKDADKERESPRGEIGRARELEEERERAQETN